MYAGHLVEIAAFAASQNRHFRQTPTDLSDWRVEQYWAISKIRLNRWHEAFHAFQRPSAWKPSLPTRWTEIQPLLTEVFLTEILTRVWSATLAVVDEIMHPGELDPVGRSVFVGHLEARRRALGILVAGRSQHHDAAESTNRLRRQCEGWTDLLLSHLLPSRIAIPFGFDLRRIHDWSECRLVPVETGHADRRWQAMNMALQLWIRTLAPTEWGVCPQQNAELGRHILSCFPASCFGTCGEPRPGWFAHPFQSDIRPPHVAILLCPPPHLPKTPTSDPSVFQQRPRLT